MERYLCWLHIAAPVTGCHHGSVVAAVMQMNSVDAGHLMYHQAVGQETVASALQLRYLPLVLQCLVGTDCFVPM